MDGDFPPLSHPEKKKGVGKMKNILLSVALFPALTMGGSGVLHIVNFYQEDSTIYAADPGCSAIILDLDPEQLLLVTANHCFPEALPHGRRWLNTTIYVPGGDTLIGERSSLRLTENNKPLDVAVVTATLGKKTFRKLSKEFSGWTGMLRNRVDEKDLLRHVNLKKGDLPDTLAPATFEDCDQATEIGFRALDVIPGESGGALVTKKGKLVGMIMEEGTNGRALSIETICEKLKRKSLTPRVQFDYKHKAWVHVLTNMGWFGMATLSLLFHQSHEEARASYETGYSLSEDKYRQYQSQSNGYYYGYEGAAVASAVLFSVEVGFIVHDWLASAGQSNDGEISK